MRLSRDSNEPNRQQTPQLAADELLSRTIHQALDQSSTALEQPVIDGVIDEEQRLTGSASEVVRRVQDFAHAHEAVVQERDAALKERDYYKRLAFEEQQKNIENRRIIDRLTEATETDVLTGIGNRVKLESEFLKLTQMHDSNRSNEVVPQAAELTHAMAIFDIDHFKVVNDTYGHPVGDIVLVGVARTISEVLRSNDIFGRLGGEEFLALLPRTDEEQATILAEKARIAVGQLKFQHAESEIKVTVSIGVGKLVVAETLREAIVESDAALYAAKRGGRDRVVRASQRAALEAGTAVKKRRLQIPVISDRDL